MIYGLLLIVLVLLSLIILAIVACQPAANDESEPTVIYTQAGRLHPGNGLQKR